MFILLFSVLILARSSNVFLKKSEALFVLKQHKDARVKEFLTEEDAIKYAETGFEVVQTKYNDAKSKCCFSVL